jgi:hypothetical protein
MITLEYNEKKVTIRGPLFNNSEAMQLGLNVKRSMDGTFYSYVNPQEKSTLKISFTGLERIKILEIFAFLKLSAGKLIRYTDPDNKIWQGKIINNPISSTHIGTKNCNLELVFEGI